MRLTSGTVKSLLPRDKPYEVPDDTLKGFLIRVQPTGNSTYYYAYRCSNGLKRRVRIGSHPSVTTTAARKAAEQHAAAVTLGKDPQAEKKKLRSEQEHRKLKTLGGFIDGKYAKWAESHLSRVSETLAMLKNSFGHLYTKPMESISKWDIEKWRSEKKQNLKPSTLNRRLTALKACLNKAVEWEIIEVNPISGVKRLKLDNSSRVRFLSTDEEKRLRQALDDREAAIRQGRARGETWRSARHKELLGPHRGFFVDHIKPIVILAMNTGMRRGELFNLRWSDISLDRKELAVIGHRDNKEERTKSGQTRYINLNSEALVTLKTWQKQVTADYVFPSPVTNQRLDNIKKGWEGLITLAKIKDFRFHDLRHTFASKLVMAGVDLYTTKELLGHSTIQMTERYAHLAPEHKALAVEKLVKIKL